MEYLKVSAKSSPASIAGAIAGMTKDGVPVITQSIGAGAVNQAVKAVAIARGFLIVNGIDLVCTPAFHEVEINGETRTAIRLTIQPCAVGHASDINGFVAVGINGQNISEEG